MGRMSAKYFARELIGFTTADVYEFWKDMGLVVKDKFGDWALTELGRSHGGKISKSNYRPVPTFEFDKIFPMMETFYLKFKGNT
jgi:hypothetical protein